MAQVSTITQPFSDYYQSLPYRIPTAIIQSAAVSFAISAIFTENLNLSLVTGAIAATISLISALTMPIFRTAFADKDGKMPWLAFAVTQTVNVGLTQLVVNNLTHLTSYKVNLMVSLFFTILFTGMLVRGFDDVDTRISPTYILI